jgi:hypothetical protein
VSSALADLLSAAAAAFADIGVRWYLFGAQAAIVHGSARLSADVDVTVDLESRTVTSLVDSLEQHGFRVRISDPERFAEQNRVVPVEHLATRIPLDVVLAGPGLEELFLAEAQERDVAGVRVPVARAEHMVIMKVLAGRPKDLDDARAILAAQIDRLSVRDIEEGLDLLEQGLDRRDLLPLLRQLLDQIQG